MSDIDTDVFDEFRKKYKCQDCDDKTFDMLLHEFEAYKRNWINEMVNFIIKELEIDEEKAQFVRANPEKYFVDYQTFKLLSFSWFQKRIIKIHDIYIQFMLFYLPLDNILSLNLT